MSVSAPSEVLDWWFADACDDPARAGERIPFWFGSSPEVDREIDERFGDTLAAAAAGELDDWAREPEPALARILVLDQFPRNIHRGSARAFACDAAALAASRAALAAGQLEGRTVPERMFFLMPFMHCEEPAVQRESCAHYEALVAAAEPAWRPLAETTLAFAREHRDLCERFGRFPHRNAVLGRAPTEAERAFLAEGGATFGQA